MPKCYQLVGIPGSGKTTWVNNQDWAMSCVYVSTDEYIESCARNLNKTYTEVFESFMPDAVKMMTDVVIKARELGKDIIWDQTSTTVLSRKKKFNMLPDYYHIAVAFKTPPVKELTTRLASRPGKTIPWKVVSGMIDNFQMPTEKEGFKEIWFVN
jgi:predicted kinase